MNYLEMMVNAMRRLGISETKSTQNNSDSDVVNLNAWFNEQLSELQGIHQWSFLQKMFYLPQGQSFKRLGGVAGNSNIMEVSSTTGIIPNKFVVDGPGIYPNTRVISIINSSQFMVDQPAFERHQFAGLSFTQDEFDLPDDFDRLTDQTMWSGNWPLGRRDPRSPNQWNNLKHMNVAWPAPQVRFFGNAIRINPAGSKMPLSLEYTSNQSVVDETGKTKQFFTSDTDTTLYDNEMVILGVIARARAHQQFDPSVAYQLYEKRRSQMISRDEGGAQVISLTNNRWNYPW